MINRFRHVAGMRSLGPGGKVGGVGEETSTSTWSMAAESVRLMVRDANGRIEKMTEWPLNGLDGLVDE